MATKKHLFWRVLGVMLLLACASVLPFAAKAQEKMITSEIITTNYDSISTEKKLYAWMRYAPSGADTCLQATVDTILFRLQKKDSITGKYVAVGEKDGYDAIHLVSVKQDSFGAKIDPAYKKVLSNGDVFDEIRALAVTTHIGLPGYGLVFNLVNDGLKITEKDSVIITLETKLLAIRCRWCGVGYSDIMINPVLDIDSSCPYPKKDLDLLYCQPRKGGAKNWEGYIRDPRDCRIYRIVHMPFNTAASGADTAKWWFARNLNYTKNMRSTENFAAGSAPFTTSGTNASVDVAGTKGYVFAPYRDAATTQNAQHEGMKTIPNGTNLVQEVATHPNGASTNAPWNMEVYGALYGYNTWRAENGVGESANGVAVTTSIPTKTYQGVCPLGWSIPADQHWGVMLNAVEGCATPASAATPGADGPAVDACAHFRSALTPLDTMTVSGVVTNSRAVASTAPSGSVENMALGTLNNMCANSVPRASFARLGLRAGRLLKASPTCPQGTINCDNFGSENIDTTYGIYSNLRHLNAASNPSRTAYTRWVYAGAKNSGVDYYGFSVLPAGMILSANTNVTSGRVNRGRGQWGIFATANIASGTALANTVPYRMFEYDRATVARVHYIRTGSAAALVGTPVSVRCIKL
ncbi:MAG: hypothetical protein ACRC3G_00425 [Bacteroidales bacterium]